MYIPRVLNFLKITKSNPFLSSKLKRILISINNVLWSCNVALMICLQAASDDAEVRYSIFKLEAQKKQQNITQSIFFGRFMNGNDVFLLFGVTFFISKRFTQKQKQTCSSLFLDDFRCAVPKKNT